MRAGLKKEVLTTLAASAALLYVTKRPKAALALGGLAGALYLGARDERNEALQGQSVLITGGSRGLGLALAVEYAKRGCRVGLLARDGEELARALARIQEEVPGAEAFPYPCDVTDPSALGLAIQAVARTQGGLDILVNNAGSISVGPLPAMEREDFEAQMRLHFYAVLDSCRLALPELRKGRGKSIVNICSMGGKVAVPHMLPYDASKFALSGLSQGLNAELAGEGISVTTVYPAVMRTGSPMQAVFKGDHEKEFAWFASSDNLPLVALPAHSAAKKIVRAGIERRAELVLPAAARARNALAALFPELSASLLAAIAAMLPKGESRAHHTGADSRALFDRAPLLKPLRGLEAHAAERWNQKPKHDARFNMGLPDKS